MKEVNSSEFKNCIGKYLDYVLSEGEIAIVRRGRTIAKLVRVNQDDWQQSKDNN